MPSHERRQTKTLRLLRLASALALAAPFLQPRAPLRPRALLLRRSAGASAPARRRLTLDEESTLAAIAQREHAFQERRRELAAALGRAPTADEWAAATVGDPARLAAATRESRRAKAALVAANGGLVVALARTYQRGRRDVSLEDLVQEGTLGLIRAAEKFDGQRGVRFGTYATFFVKAAIGAWLRRGDAAIRVPSRVADLETKAGRASEQLEAALGRDPTRREVARAVNASSEALAAAAAAARVRGVSSYDAPLGEATRFVDALADERPPADDLRSDLAAALEAELTPRELRVVRLRYGLDDGTPRSTRDCAALLGVGRESVRQTCLKAFRRLRGTPHGAALLDYV